MSTMTDALTEVFAYHEATKHHLHRYAAGPGGLDAGATPAIHSGATPTRHC